MSETSLKQAIQELTKTKGENVSLTGRLEGYARKYEELEVLFEQANRENRELHRLLDGRINELRGDQDTTIPKRLLSDHVVSPARSVLSSEYGDTVTDADKVPENQEAPEAWRPLFTETSQSNKRRLSPSPPRDAPGGAQLTQQLSDIASSVEEVTGRDDAFGAIATRLAKLADDIFEYEELTASDKKKLADLEKKNTEQKVRIQELEMELMAVRLDNTLRQHGEKRSAVDRQGLTRSDQETSELDRVRGEYEDKIARLTAQTEEQFRVMSDHLSDSRTSKKRIQTNFDDCQQELQLQLRTNQALQNRIAEFEEEKWHWQQQTRDLKREMDRLRQDRRLQLHTVSSAAPASMSSVTATMQQEMEILQCQADTFREDFENERKDREKISAEKDEALEQMRRTVTQFDAMKYAYDRKERILKRKLETAEKENTDLLKIIEEFERKHTGHRGPSNPARRDWSPHRATVTTSVVPGRPIPNSERHTFTTYREPTTARTGPLVPTAPSTGLIRPINEGHTEVLSPLWLCPVCTFGNPPTRHVCEMCMHPRSDTGNRQTNRLQAGGSNMSGVLGEDLTCDGSRMLGDTGSRMLGDTGSKMMPGAPM